MGKVRLLEQGQGLLTARGRRLIGGLITGAPTRPGGLAYFGAAAACFFAFVFAM